MNITSNPVTTLGTHVSVGTGVPVASETLCLTYEQWHKCVHLKNTNIKYYWYYLLLYNITNVMIQI